MTACTWYEKRSWYERHDEDLERESEFTGLKGWLLRYLGSAWALVIASQLVKALALAQPAAADPLWMISEALFIAAPAAFPAYSLISGSTSSSMEPAR